MNNILVVRYGTIGDSIFASAFYRELRQAMPDAVIDALVDNIAKGVMKNCPYVDNFININHKYRNLKYYTDIFKKYDTVFFLKNDAFFTKTAFLAGVKNRIGFDVIRNKFLTKKAPYKKENRSEIECYLDLLRLVGIEPKSNKTELWIDEQSEKNVKKFLDNVCAKKVLIQAFSRFKQKNWVNDYWVQLIKYLSDESDMQIYFSGGEKDRADYEILEHQLKDIKHKPINLCSEKLSVIESMAVVKNMDLVIGIDSCSVHMAAAADVACILIHGCTSIKRWRPASEKCTVVSKFFPCSPCFLQTGTKKFCKKKISQCMLALTPNDIIHAIEDINIQNPKVSVIVVSCENSKYLPKCLDSIINQTEKNIQIICLDNNSNNDTSLILKEYKKYDNRIKILNSSDKIQALNEACSENILFVKANTWLSNDFIENMNLPKNKNYFYLKNYALKNIENINIFKFKRVIRKYKVLGVPVFAKIQKRNCKIYKLFNLIKWRKKNAINAR